MCLGMEKNYKHTHIITQTKQCGLCEAVRSRQIGCSGKSLSLYANTRQTLIVIMAVSVCVD